MQDIVSIKRALPLFALATLMTGLLIAVSIWQSAAFAPAALLLYAAFLLWLLRAYPVAFILLLWFVFIRFTVMISGVAIESGGTMHEILMDGYASGAFARLAVLYAIGILFTGWCINTLTKAAPANPAGTINNLWVSGILAFTVLFAAFAFWIGLQNGFPLLTGIDRIAYWRAIDNRFFYFFLGNRVILGLLLGLIFASSKTPAKHIALALFALLIALSFMFAEKFTSISILLFAFVTPVFLLKQKWLETATTRMIVVAIAVCVLTLPVIFTVYGVFDDPAKAVERFQSRVTSQGQLWFYADAQQDRLFMLDATALKHNINAALSTDPEALSETPPYLGVKTFMNETLAPDRLTHYRKQGITLTMGLEAYLLKSFGWLGMIPVYLFILTIYAAELAYLYYAIQKRDPLRIIVIAKILVWTNFGLNQGYLWHIIGLKPLALIAVLILLELTLKATRKEGAAHAP